MSRFYLTTAIDYVNSRPHLGTAYEKITADVIARYKRLCGIDTHFLMGNDEHSQNVYRRAVELGLEPLAYCDRMEDEFREVWAKLEISFDDFIRTTDRKRHFPAVQRLAQACYDKGDIYEGVYEGWYCVGCEAFKPAKDLVDGSCPIHQTKAEWIREKNWFFRLSKYQERLLRLYAEHPRFIEPEVRRNEILRLVEGGLEDISMSRAGQSWGIPLPFDASSVVYVWFDALINYAAAVGYGWNEEQYRTWWPADLHVIGKDITRFHCVVWPAMLMSAGVEPPRQVFGHGWVHFGGQKMSKTLGTVVDPLEAADRLGPDPLRLYLVKEIPYGNDGDFSWERFEERYNVDLANNLGNLVSRVAAMADRYRRGELAPPAGPAGRLASVATEAAADYRKSMDRFALHEGAAAAYRLVDAANEFIAATEPWALAREASQADRLNQVLYEASEAVRIAGLLLLPIMPRSAGEILRRMGETQPIASLRLDRDAAWRTGGARTIVKADQMWPRLEGGAPVATTTSGGTRPMTDEQKTPSTPPAAPAAPAAAPAAAPEPSGGDRISIDEFMKVELRVARILEAERVPNSKKLIKMTVDLGTERRTLVAGIAEAYEPAALVGKTVAVVANLKPAKLMGIESNGMILAASPDGGQPVLVAFDGVPAPGSRIR
jgi:methionyl-tRNA synthetase